MNRDEDKVIENHVYDGIQEYDNPLPTWWLITFFGTIIFAFIYYIHYEIADGPTLQQELEIALKEVQQQKAVHGLKGPQTDADYEAIVAQSSANGAKAIFESRCAACHGPELQGLIGPDLTDSYWIHNKGTVAGIYKIIEKGVTEKGMPPWGEILTQQEIGALVAYIESKKGSQPKGSKGPQGELAE